MLKLRMLLEAVDKASGPIRRLRGLIKTVGRDQEKLTRIQERAVRTAGRLGTAFGGMAGLIGTSAIGATTGMVLLAGRFEQFQVVLENTEGSAGAARKAMDWVKRFARETPFEIEQVMDAYVKLRAYGIDPTQGALMSLGNAASGMGKDLSAAVEMLADAATGEFERLKEFGVRAKVQGDRVAFTYMKNGKEMRREARNSAGDIQAALTGIFDDRFSGMMARQSRTIFGLWSNLKDRISNFSLDAAKGGPFDFIKAKLEALMAWLDARAKDGSLAAWAKELGEALTNLAKWLASIDWRKAGQTVIAFARALWGVVKVIGWLHEKLTSLPLIDDVFDIGMVGVIGRMSFALYGFAAALGVVSVAGAPLWAIVAIIGAIGFLAYKLIRNWDKVTAFFASMWERVKSIFKSAAAAIWETLPAWLRGVFTGARFVFSAVGNIASGQSLGDATNNAARSSGILPPQRARPAVGKKTAALDVGGRVVVDLRTPQGVSARVRTARSDNRAVPIVIERGRAMGGAA